MAGELEAGYRAGRAGPAHAGRPAAEDVDPGLVAALEALVDPGLTWDPMCPLRWPGGAMSSCSPSQVTSVCHQASRCAKRLANGGDFHDFDDFDDFDDFGDTGEHVSDEQAPAQRHTSRCAS